MASCSRLLFAYALLVFPLAVPLRGDTLKITSTPSGATVEIDGVSVGTTPYKQKVPGGYFHKTRTALGRRLQHSVVARISLPGYTTKEIQMTEGPMRPTAAEVYVDGKFVGGTPATLQLAAGKSYVILVKAPGRTDWSREISVLAGMRTVLGPWVE